MASNNNLIQEAIKELQVLSLRKPLEGSDLSDFQLMGILREAGWPAGKRAIQWSVDRAYNKTLY